VELIHTIPEFVDNSIDGAVRQTDESNDYSDYFVRIEMDSSHLEIKDNCGGIPLNVAEEYAFRFGRPDGVKEVAPTRIGEFGIGMKRSLFKIGKKFRIESKTHENHYLNDVDVEEWRENEENWDFPIELYEEGDGRFELSEVFGTRISVVELTDAARSEFGKELFESKLVEEVTSRNRQFLNDGFEIIINNTNLAYREMEIFQSEELEPAYERFKHQTADGEVKVRIVCGLGDKSNSDAGWYVFCNGRLVLDADQSETTGWGGSYGGDSIPNFHGQFNRFRGMVYFESEQSSVLPWNTTKTGVNTDSDVYGKAREKMVSMARPVIDFLNEVSEQRREMESDDKPDLEKKVEQAQLTDMTSIEVSDNQTFSGPSAEEEEQNDGPEMTTIRYQEEKSRVETAKSELGVDTNKEVGEKTFEYFWELESLED